MLSLLKTAYHKTLDAVLPPLCPLCHVPVDSAHAICASCWPQVNFISPPHCARCSVPFPVEAVADSVCLDCLSVPPLYTRAYSALVYDDISRRLVLSLKRGDHTHLAPTLASWLARPLTPARENIDLIVPVPLAFTRLLSRRFNQAALLATHLGRHLDKPVDLFSLKRKRPTKSQGGLNRKERAKNVKNAFEVAPRHLQKVTGKNILLVDDVLTTGATINAATESLLQAGAQSVSVATLARVPLLRE